MIERMKRILEAYGIPCDIIRNEEEEYIGLSLPNGTGVYLYDDGCFWATDPMFPSLIRSILSAYAFAKEVSENGRVE